MCVRKERRIQEDHPRSSWPPPAYGLATIRSYLQQMPNLDFPAMLAYFALIVKYLNLMSVTAYTFKLLLVNDVSFCVKGLILNISGQCKIVGHV